MFEDGWVAQQRSHHSAARGASLTRSRYGRAGGNGNQTLCDDVSVITLFTNTSECWKRQNLRNLTVTAAFFYGGALFLKRRLNLRRSLP